MKCWLSNLKAKQLCAEVLLECGSDFVYQRSSLNSELMKGPKTTLMKLKFGDKTTDPFLGIVNHGEIVSKNIVGLALLLPPVHSSSLSTPFRSLQVSVEYQNGGS